MSILPPQFEVEKRLKRTEKSTEPEFRKRSNVINQLVPLFPLTCLAPHLRENRGASWVNTGFLTIGITIGRVRKRIDLAKSQKVQSYHLGFNRL